jgi:SAM-dependent methyltransferase
MLLVSQYRRRSRRADSTLASSADESIVLPFHCPTEHTIEFLGGVLPRDGARVLEVGCGGGDVALQLGKIGHRVVGIDTSKEAVQRARALGVDVREADLFTFDASPFDVVLFTRSLHHVRRLPAAMERAKALLAPGGLLVLEELDVGAMDDATATWLFDVEALLEASGVMRVDMEEARSSPGDPLSRWRAVHAQNRAVHTGSSMLDAVQRSFHVTMVERAPYLYRYVEGRLESTERGYRVLREALSIEGRRIKDKTIRALGLRVVARRA